MLIIKLACLLYVFRVDVFINNANLDYIAHPFQRKFLDKLIASDLHHRGQYKKH